MRILVVEDEPRLATSLKQGLQEAHYAVDLALTGDDGLLWASMHTYDAIILDVLLPDRDGISICRALRAARNTAPILLLTALGEVDDKVRGLDAGADDYLTKPFAFKELLARLRALLRRETIGNSAYKSPILQVADLTLDTTTHEVQRSGRHISLTSKEYALLEYLMRNAGQVLSRSMIAEHVWDYEAEHMSNIVDVYIRYLRRKLDEGFEPRLLHTVRGWGYQLKEG
jgi:DNA-binding response OmpR family regulator